MSLVSLRFFFIDNNALREQIAATLAAAWNNPEVWESTFVEANAVPSVQKVFKALSTSQLPQDKFRKILGFVVDYMETNVCVSAAGYDQHQPTSHEA